MKPKYIQLPPLPLDLPTEVIEMIWLYIRLSGEEQEIIRSFQYKKSITKWQKQREMRNIWRCWIKAFSS